MATIYPSTAPPAAGRSRPRWTPSLGRRRAAVPADGRPATLAPALDLVVGFVGRRASAWLAAGVRAVPVRRGDAAELRPGGHPLDALVVDVAAGRQTPELAPLLQAARRQRTPVVAVGTPAEHAAAAPLPADVVLRAGADFLPPVDLRLFNPVGFDRQACGLPAALLTADAAQVAVGARELARRIQELEFQELEFQELEFQELEFVSLDGEVDSATVVQLRDRGAVVDHAGLHTGIAPRALLLARLAAAGVPVVLADALDERLRRLLGDPLADALSASGGQPPANPQARERLSVALRRAALRDHTPLARWTAIARQAGLPSPPPRTVSVVVSTNRPDYLDNLTRQYDRQSYSERELVVVLHGDAFPADAGDRLRRRVRGPLTVVRAAAGATLGDALNVGSAAARGAVLSKMDDDDWYGADHLLDLVTALDYSGADLVGKGAEFVYLAELGITVRRFTGYAETPSRSLGGGTLALHRDALRRAGGWPSVPTGVDQRLIDALLKAGGHLHRTHACGYLLNRHGVGHTWSSGIEYFIEASEVQRRGLDLDLAGCA